MGIGPRADREARGAAGARRELQDRVRGPRRRPAKAARIPRGPVETSGSKPGTPADRSLKSIAPSPGAGEALRAGPAVIGSVFKDLKQDLGLRPVCRVTGDRAGSRRRLSCLTRPLTSRITLKPRASGIRDCRQIARERQETRRLADTACRAAGKDAAALAFSCPDQADGAPPGRDGPGMSGRPRRRGIQVLRRIAREGRIARG